MIPHQTPPPDADLTSADEFGQHVASSFSQAPCLFEHDCIYYPDIARGLPMFRIIESTDSSSTAQCSVSVRDSFGEGVYIETNRSDRLCSTDCHCHRLGGPDLAFLVSKDPTHIMIDVWNEALQNTLIDVIGLDEQRFPYGLGVWDGAQLLAQYENLEARLRAVIHAPVGSVDTQPFLPLRLLVDGFLGQGLERSPQYKDASYILRDVFLEQDRNSILDAELLEAARKGSIRDIRNLFSHSKLELENAAGRTSPIIASSTKTLGISPGVQVMEDPVPEAININAHDMHGNTALIHAAFAGHLSIVMYLFCQDADIAWANNKGETALHKAAKAKHIDLVSFLIQSGADIHAKDNSGATPVHSWSSWAYASSPDLKKLILALRKRRERNMENTSRRSIIESWTDQVLERTAIEPTIDDYQNLVSKPDQQLKIRNIKEAKAAVRGFFIQQYYKVRQHEIFERVRGRFPNSTRAWQFGMEALQKISYGYLPHDFGMTMAFLCVCKAVSLTLDTYGCNPPSDRPPWANHQKFEESLSHWLPLFHGDDGMLFAKTVRSIWNVHIFPFPWLFSSVDHHAMFQYVERLTSDLIDAVERLSSPPTLSAEQRAPNQAPQGTNEQQPPPPNDPDPGDPCIATESTQHIRTAISRGARSRKSLLWVELMASSIFRILLMFLLWLVSLHLSTGTVQSVAICTTEWPIDADAQSVARSTQPCFTDSPEAQQPLSVPSPAPEQDVIMSGQGYDDRNHTQPLESQALSHSSGVPGSVHESSRSPRPFACLESNCKKRFTRKDNRDRHFKNHHGPESEKHKLCEACRKEYGARYFRDHTCNPNKPFKRRSRKGD